MPRTPEVLAAWDALLKENYGYQHIAEMYGVAKETVRREFPGRGWTQAQIREHGTAVRHLNAKVRRTGMVRF